MNKFVISPEQAAELEQLNRDLLIAQERVSTAFQTRGRIRELKGE